MICPPFRILKTPSPVSSIHGFSYPSDTPSSTPYDYGITADMRVAAGYEDGWIRIWNVHLNKIERAIEFTPNHSILGVNVSVQAPSHVVYAQSRAGVIRAWDLSTGQQLVEYECQQNNYCAFSISGDYLAIPLEQSVVVRQLHGKEDPVRTVQVDCVKDYGMLTCLKLRGSTLAMGYEIGNIVLFDIQTNLQRVVKIDVGVDDEKAPVTALDFHPRKPYLICGFPSNNLVKLNLETLEYKSREYPSEKPGIACLKVNQDTGLTTICACWDGAVRVIQSKNIKVLAVLAEQRCKVHTCAILDGTHSIYAAGSDTGAIFIWHLPITPQDNLLR